jgi:hypothetical protein
MILDKRQSRWARFTGIASVAALTVYIAYVVLSPNGARGGSLMGLFFASLGIGIIVFECLLSLRKKYPASPLGQVKTWLSAHVWLGLLSFLLILMHSGFRWGQGLAELLMWVFVVIVASGITGVALQNYIPRRMTELVKRETIYEQIPTVVRGLRLEADERVEFITADLGVREQEPEFVRAGGIKRYYDPEQKKGNVEKVQKEVDRRRSSPQIVIEEDSREVLRGQYLKAIRPFLEDSPAPFSLQVFDEPEHIAAYFERLRILMPPGAHQVVRDLEEICEERRQLIVQARLHRWLHSWLLVHVPLSFAFLVLSVVHAVLSLRY